MVRLDNGSVRGSAKVVRLKAKRAQLVVVVEGVVNEGATAASGDRVDDCEDMGRTLQ